LQNKLKTCKKYPKKVLTCGLIYVILYMQSNLSWFTLISWFMADRVVWPKSATAVKDCRYLVRRKHGAQVTASETSDSVAERFVI